MSKDKSVKNDRFLGYAVIVFITVFLIVPVAYLIWQAQEPFTVRTIAFDNVHSLSFLSQQDPVRLRGVEIGVVRKVTIRDSIAYVKIETKNDILIHGNYRISIVAKGVMGDRYLTIDPGDPDKKIIPPETLLHATIGIAIDDALPYINQLKSTLHQLTRFSYQLKNGTDNQKSLIAEIWQFTTGADSIINALIDQFSIINTSLKNGFDSSIKLLDTTYSIASTLSDSLPSIISTFNTLLASTDSTLGKIESFIASADTITEKLNNPSDGILWKKQVESVNDKLKELQQLLNDLQEDTISLPVRLW